MSFNAYQFIDSFRSLNDWVRVLNTQSANTINAGYKSERATFVGNTTQQVDLGTRGLFRQAEKTISLELSRDFSQGEIQASHSLHHLAIRGDGWFPVSISLAAGSPVFFTRNGEFHEDENGRYRTNEGYYLLSADDLEDADGDGYLDAHIVRTTASGPPNNIPAGAVGVSAATVQGGYSYIYANTAVGTDALTRTTVGNGVLRDDFTGSTVDTSIWQAPGANVSIGGGVLTINGGNFSSIIPGGGNYGAVEWSWRDNTYNTVVSGDTSQRYFWLTGSPWIDFGRQGMGNYYTGVDTVVPNFEYGDWWADGDYHTARMEVDNGNVRFYVDGNLVRSVAGVTPTAGNFQWVLGTTVGTPMSVSVDHFTFYRNTPISFTGLPANGTVEILDASGNPTGISGTANAAGNASVSPNQLTFQFPGNFQFRIRDSGGNVLYTSGTLSGVNGGDAYAFNLQPLTVTNVPAGMRVQLVDTQGNIISTSTTAGPGPVTMTPSGLPQGGYIQLVDGAGNVAPNSRSGFMTLRNGDSYDLSFRRGLEPALFTDVRQNFTGSILGTGYFQATGEFAAIQPWQSNGAGVVVPGALEAANSSLQRVAPELNLAKLMYETLAKVMQTKISNLDLLMRIIH